jgi:hypothetical protein
MKINAIRVGASPRHIAMFALLPSIDRLGLPHSVAVSILRDHGFALVNFHTDKGENGYYFAQKVT